MGYDAAGGQGGQGASSRQRRNGNPGIEICGRPGRRGGARRAIRYPPSAAQGSAERASSYTFQRPRVGRPADTRRRAASERQSRSQRAPRVRFLRRVVRLHRRSEEHTSELQSRENLVCRLLLEKKKIKTRTH